jgi:hypothetical protein
MHDQLFEHQDALDDASLLLHAAALGLDQRRFCGTRERDAPATSGRGLSERHAQRRSRDADLFINGIRHAGPWDAVSLLAALEGDGVPALPAELKPEATGQSPARG